MYSDNTWLQSLSVIDANTVNESMYSCFIKPNSNIVGWAKWNDNQTIFEQISIWPNTSFMTWMGSQAPKTVLKFANDENAYSSNNITDYQYYTAPFVYARAHESAIETGNATEFESFTPLIQGCNMSNPIIDKNGWGWKKNMPIFTQSDETELIEKGILSLNQSRYQTKYFAHKTTITDNANVYMKHDHEKRNDAIVINFGQGSVNWNEYLSKYILITEGYKNGDIWLSISDGDMYGPWNKAYLIAQHNSTGMVCYNPIQLPFMGLKQNINININGSGTVNDQYIYFACTFTAMWSQTYPANQTAWWNCLFGQNSHINCANVVPRYEYNNLIYKVNLKQFSETLLV